MKNIQIVDGATNATFSVFEATDEEYLAIFPDGRDMELAEDLIERLGENEAGRILALLTSRPKLKRDVIGLHGTLFYNDERRHIPPSKQEIDWDDRSINSAQRKLFSHYRE